MTAELRSLWPVAFSVVDFGCWCDIWSEQKKGECMEPKPLTPGQKKSYIILLVVGIVIVTIGITVSINNEGARFLPGALLGMGGGMLGISLIGLFHRPDR